MMPDIFNSKLPGLSRVSSSELVRRNLEAKKKASEEFIKIVDCEKVKRALSRNVRDTNMDKINIGDEVYYKRNDSEEWHGPGKVMLLEKNIATVRHGGCTLRVHGVSLVKAPEETSDVARRQSDSIFPTGGPANDCDIGIARRQSNSSTLYGIVIRNRTVNFSQPVGHNNHNTDSY